MTVHDMKPLDRSLSRRRLGALAAGGSAAALIGTTGVAAQSATPVASPVALTEEQQGWVDQASKGMNNGWMHVRIQGAPFARGFQYGYLTAAEYAEAIRVYTEMTYQTMGMDYSFFVDKAAEYHKDKITPELIEEMEGLAAGYTTAGVPTTLDDIIGWNAYMEMTGYWWPTVATQYANSAPNGNRKSHCSAFIATGSATADGQIVIGHRIVHRILERPVHERDPGHHSGRRLSHRHADQSRVDREHDRLLGDWRWAGGRRDDDGRLRRLRRR